MEGVGSQGVGRVGGGGVGRGGMADGQLADQLTDCLVCGGRLQVLPSRRKRKKEETSLRWERLGSRPED